MRTLSTILVGTVSAMLLSACNQPAKPAAQAQKPAVRSQSPQWVQAPAGQRDAGEGITVVVNGKPVNMRSGQTVTIREDGQEVGRDGRFGEHPRREAGEGGWTMLPGSATRPGTPFGGMMPKPEMVKEAFLGVAVEPPSPALRAQFKLPDETGLMVEALEPNGPAAKAGIEKFDILTKFNDQILIDQHQLMVLVHNSKEGDAVTLTVIHQGKEQPVKVTLGTHEVPKNPMPMMNPWMRPGMPMQPGMPGMGKPGMHPGMQLPPGHPAVPGMMPGRPHTGPNPPMPGSPAPANPPIPGAAAPPPTPAPAANDQAGPQAGAADPNFKLGPNGEIIIQTTETAEDDDED